MHVETCIHTWGKDKKLKLKQEIETETKTETSQCPCLSESVFLPSSLDTRYPIALADYKLGQFAV